MKYINTDKEIEVGDQVMYEGEVTNVVSLNHYLTTCPDVKLGNGSCLVYSTQFNNLEYIPNTLTPHIHRDVIIAYANGFEIEYLGDCSGEWFSIEHPNFYPEDKYRIKPIVTKSPAQLEKEAIKEEMDKLSKRLEELDVE